MGQDVKCAMIQAFKPLLDFFLRQTNGSQPPIYGGIPNNVWRKLYQS